MSPTPPSRPTDFARREYRRMGPIEYIGFYLLAALAGGGCGAFVYFRMMTRPATYRNTTRTVYDNTPPEVAAQMLTQFVLWGVGVGIVALTIYLFFIVPRERAEDAAIARRIETAEEKEERLRQALVRQAAQREETERRRTALESLGRPSDRDRAS